MKPVWLIAAVLLFSFSFLFADEQDALTAALDEAIIKNDTDAVASLLEAGADPAAKDKNGFPIVFRAIFFNDNLRNNILPLLVKRGAPVNEFDYKDKTLLMRTAERKADHLVKFLLDHGADPNLQNKKGETALMYAETEAAVKYLIAAGADPNLQNEDGETALLHAWLHPLIISTLLEAGADATHIDLRGNTAMHYWGYMQNANVLEDLLSRGCLLDEPNHDGFTPLMIAAQSGHGRAVLTLLEKGADASRRDKDGISILYHYLRISDKEQVDSFLVDDDKEKMDTVVAALLAAGANPAGTDDEGNSALLYVMKEIKYKYNNVKYLKLLRDMMLEYTSADEKKAAKAVMAKRSREDFADNLPSIITALALPLIIGGISILMREGIYANNKSANFLGPVNGVLTLGGSGLAIGFLIGAAGFEGSGSWSDMFGPAVNGFIGGIIGFIGGFIIACLPPVRRAFTNIPALYYAPTAISVLTAGIIIFKI